METYDGQKMREYLQTITDDSVLSKRLDIVRAQIPLAHKKEYTEILTALMDHEQAIINRRMELLDD